MGHEDNVGALVREVRVAFYRLKALGDDLNAQLGITGALRGVMDTLLEHGPATVPQIARRRRVSRQHIQALVDVMWERKLCSLSANPAHARSAVIELTPKGRALLETLEECEQPLLTDVASEVPADVAGALAVLRRLNAALLRRMSE